MNFSKFTEVYSFILEVIDCKESEGCLAVLQVLTPPQCSCFRKLQLNCKALESESDNESKSVDEDMKNLYSAKK